MSGCWSPNQSANQSLTQLSAAVRPERTSHHPTAGAPMKTRRRVTKEGMQGKRQRGVEEEATRASVLLLLD